MMTSDGSRPTVSEIWSLEKPDGRFNDWGERKWLAIPLERQLKVDQEITGLNLTSRALDLFKAAKLTGSEGVEFVFFSNAQILQPAGIDDNGLIVPCFLPLNPLNPQTEDRQAAMMKRGIFIYDGWITVAEWTEEKLEKIILSLDHIAALFSVVGKYHAYWEPKYRLHKPPIPSQLFHSSDLQALSASLQIMSQLPPEDRAALNRSIGWISSATQNTAVPKFLLLFVSIESLATYIESRQTSASSILKQAFAGERLPKAHRRRARDKCIKKTLKEAPSLVSGIERAYSVCVQPSISTKLARHLDRIFGNEAARKIMFDEAVDGKTLWLLRNDVAHGNLNVLNEADVRFISNRVRALEEIARNYIRLIFTRLVDTDFFPATRPPILNFPVSHGVGTENTEYQGPTDMAEYYLQVEALSSSHVRVSF